MFKQRTMDTCASLLSLFLFMYLCIYACMYVCVLFVQVDVPLLETSGNQKAALWGWVLSFHLYFPGFWRLDSEDQVIRFLLQVHLPDGPPTDKPIFHFLGRQDPSVKNGAVHFPTSINLIKNVTHKHDRRLAKN